MAKTQMIPDSAWARYKQIVNDFIDEDAGKSIITWRQHLNQPAPFAEDSNNNYLDRDINVLVGYNYFRTWPVNKNTVTGELDSESCVIWVSARYLSEIGALASRGPNSTQNYWKFSPDLDRFILNGITYKASGDTQVAQAKDEALLFMVILKREELND